MIAMTDVDALRADVREMRGEINRLQRRVSTLERVEDLRKAKAQVHRERDERSWFARTRLRRAVAWGVATALTATIAAASIISALH